MNNVNNIKKIGTTDINKTNNNNVCNNCVMCGNTAQNGLFGEVPEVREVREVPEVHEVHLKNTISCIVNGTYNEHNEYNQIVLCDVCQSNHAMFSKTFCINELLLSKHDLEGLRYFIKGSSKLFLEDDIQILIEQKYGDINSYNIYKENKITNKKQKQTVHQTLIQQRKEQLIDKLIEYKLEYKPYGDCYTYVHYGYPKIDNVIENELEKYKKIFSRKQEILCECEKLGRSLDEQIGSEHYNYIYGISNLYKSSDTNDDHVILFD